jgi:endonuclease/exonuclease/phosphatase (EEP) superfamily protein YafD
VTRRLPPFLVALAALAALSVLVQASVQARTGPLPLVSAFEIHLLVAALLVGLLAFAVALASRHARAMTGLVVGVVAVIALARAGGETWSPSPAAAGDGATLAVLTWNLEMGSKAAATSVEGIAGMDADVVALQELTPDVAAAIEADDRLASRYPYRLLEPRVGVDGMGLLSRLPLTSLGSGIAPLVQRVRLTLPDGRTIDMLNVHPYPPGISLAAGVPVGLDTRRRDGDLVTIAGQAERTPDGAILVAGDLNTTPTEPGFAVLAQGLTDVHAAVGTGPGFTWRPSSLEGLGVGFLRLDHVLAGSQLTPVAAVTDCSIPGDHCRLLVALRVPRAD